MIVENYQVELYYYIINFINTSFKKTIHFLHGKVFCNLILILLINHAKFQLPTINIKATMELSMKP